eukprot:scaffold325156_cov57-Tisochrysis_lutea.AAC.2
MDFVGGGDLFTLLEKRRRFPEEWARVYAGEIALALQHLHEEGIIFRDLKPENVMVSLDGHLKLTDFGLAKKVDVGAVMRGSCACSSATRHRPATRRRPRSPAAGLRPVLPPPCRPPRFRPAIWPSLPSARVCLLCLPLQASARRSTWRLS